MLNVFLNAYIFKNVMLIIKKMNVCLCVMFL